MEILEGKSRLAEKGHATFLWSEEFVTVATEELTVLVGHWGKMKLSLKPSIRECQSIAHLWYPNCRICIKRSWLNLLKRRMKNKLEREQPFDCFTADVQLDK